MRSFANASDTGGLWRKVCSHLLHQEGQNLLKCCLSVTCAVHEPAGQAAVSTNYIKKKKSPAKLFNSVTDFLGIWRVYVLFVFVWFFSLFVVCLFVWGVFCFCFSSPKSSLILLAPLAISVGKVNETTWDIGKIFRKQRGILYPITTEIQKKWFLFSLQAFFLFRVKFDG